MGKLFEEWPEPPTAGDETAALLGALERQRADGRLRVARLTPRTSGGRGAA